jgi:hypothetical protein
MRPDPPLPSLRDLERELAGRTSPEPPARLRDRILAAVAAERHLATDRPPRPLWKGVWAAAAAVVLALNLAMSAVNAFRYESLSSGVAQPGRAAPTDADDRFPSFAASALTRLTPAPDAELVARRFLEQKEN